MIKMMKHPDFKEDYDVVDRINEDERNKKEVEEIDRADMEEAQEMLDFHEEERRARWHI
jgi:hypothetical protein